MTKADTIQGFLEFLRSLPEDERNHALWVVGHEFAAPVGTAVPSVEFASAYGCPATVEPKRLMLLAFSRKIPTLRVLRGQYPNMSLRAALELLESAPVELPPPWGLSWDQASEREEFMSHLRDVGATISFN